MARVQVRPGVSARFVTNPKTGLRVLLVAGHQLDENDPIVKKWPEWFERPGSPLADKPKRGRPRKTRTATAEPVAETAVNEPEIAD